MTKDNIIETVPLSAIRKVIELDAQDARELRAVAVEMLTAIEEMILSLHDERAASGNRKAWQGTITELEKIVRKAKAIL